MAQRFNSPIGSGGMMAKKPQTATMEPGMDEQDGSMVNEQHGPPMQVNTEHEDEMGTHHVHSMHQDGHEHHSDHASREEAHEHVGKLHGIGAEKKMPMESDDSEEPWGKE